MKNICKNTHYKKIIIFYLIFLFGYLPLGCQILFADERVWKKEASLGYSRCSGNTEKDELSMSVLANRKTSHDEFTLKGDVLYSSTDNKMDTQKWNGTLRYAFSFGENKWYNFYKLETNHDRFANIDYRIIPSLGIGYWFSDEEDWKAMVEGGCGFEYTDFRDNTDEEHEAILVPRAFFEKSIFSNASIKEDFYLYPSLDDAEVFRLHSETVFINPIDENLSLQLSLVDDYDSDPAESAEKNDVRFTSSLVYSF